MKGVSLLSIFMLCLLLTGCCRSSDDVWDDTKTAGRHMCKGFKSLGGKHGESRQVGCREDFLYYESDEVDYCTQAPQESKFIAISDEVVSDEIAMVDIPVKQQPRQPTVTPGDQGGHVPGIEEFRDPTDDVEVGEVFKNIQFPYNSSLIKGKDNMRIVRKIVDFMKNNENTYLFIEGHCDERGAEAYNLALGARRSNSTRNLLMKYGISPELMYTVSYGKDKPVTFDHTEEAWAKNRRAQFKIYRQ